MLPMPEKNGCFLCFEIPKVAAYLPTVKEFINLGLILSCSLRLLVILHFEGKTFSLSICVSWYHRFLIEVDCSLVIKHNSKLNSIQTLQMSQVFLHCLVQMSQVLIFNNRRATVDLCTSW
jgi:hypothetical protein